MKGGSSVVVFSSLWSRSSGNIYFPSAFLPPGRNFKGLYWNLGVDLLFSGAAANGCLQPIWLTKLLPRNKDDRFVNRKWNIHRTGIQPLCLVLYVHGVLKHEKINECLHWLFSAQKAVNFGGYRFVSFVCQQLSYLLWSRALSTNGVSCVPNHISVP